jgi:hypothetical protein
MPEWRRLVRERLAGVDLPPADEIGIVEELAQHLEDRYRELCSAGQSDEEALRASLDEIAANDFTADLKESLDGRAPKDQGAGDDDPRSH